MIYKLMKNARYDLTLEIHMTCESFFSLFKPETSHTKREI